MTIKYKLPLAMFKTVIASTPLVSIDLIVRNKDGEVLLGKRKNRPAKGYWFVPGGRILKDETFDSAMSRLINEELGQEKVVTDFKGIYQHFYDDNFSEENFTTHYIVLAYEMEFSGSLASFTTTQHCEYKWFTDTELLNTGEVHKHTKWYFQENTQADTNI